MGKTIFLIGTAEDSRHTFLSTLRFPPFYSSSDRIFLFPSSRATGLPLTACNTPSLASPFLLLSAVSVSYPLLSLLSPSSRPREPSPIGFPFLRLSLPLAGSSLLQPPPFLPQVVGLSTLCLCVQQARQPSRSRQGQMTAGAADSGSELARGARAVPPAASFFCYYFIQADRKSVV